MFMLVGSHTALCNIPRSIECNVAWMAALEAWLTNPLFGASSRVVIGSPIGTAGSPSHGKTNAAGPCHQKKHNSLQNMATVRGGSADPRLCSSDGRGTVLTGLHVQLRLAVGDVLARRPPQDHRGYGQCDHQPIRVAREVFPHLPPQARLSAVQRRRYHQGQVAPRRWRIR
jgi:hypothetical protein